jgi:hypothetical protein
MTMEGFSFSGNLPHSGQAPRVDPLDHRLSSTFTLSMMIIALLASV